MKRDYLTIPGLGTGRGSFRIAMRHRLYQGPDHLLLIQSTGFTDDYRRLYYRDIGCVVVRRTARGNWISAVFGILIAVMLLLLATAWRHRAESAGLGFIAVATLVLVIVLVINIARGPTCACYVTTQVQTVVVPTPQRLAKVPRLIEFLRAKMAEARPEASVATPSF